MKLKYILPVIVVGLLATFLMMKNPVDDTKVAEQVAKNESVAAKSYQDCAMSQEDFLTLDKQANSLDPAAEATMTNWKISFGGQNITWTKSDLVQQGTFVCQKNVITADFQGTTMQGLYNPVTGLLVFDGKNYQVPEN